MNIHFEHVKTAISCTFTNRSLYFLKITNSYFNRFWQIIYFSDQKLERFLWVYHVFKFEQTKIMFASNMSKTPLVLTFFCIFWSLVKWSKFYIFLHQKVSRILDIIFNLMLCNFFSKTLLFCKTTPRTWPECTPSGPF